MNTPIQCIIKNDNHPSIKNSIIWLHGLGANAHDFETLDRMLSIDTQRTRIVLPNAPIRPITINQQQPCPAWYDIYSLSDINKEDITGIQSSENIIHQLIQSEIDKGTPSTNIFLGGFSQGGAMALYTGLRYQHALGGIIGLSTYLPLANKLESEKNTSNQKTPIFQAHGSNDAVLPEYLGHASYQVLKNSDYPIVWKTYPMAHQVCESELQDLSLWLQQQPAFAHD